MNFVMRALVLLVAAAGCGAVHAVVTTVATYRLGESDTGAVVGGPGANPTVGNPGTALPRFGAPVYAGDVPGVISSTLSMRFNGTDSRYSVAGVASTATDNFGIEAWVRSATTTFATANAAIAYNGNTGNSGWGLFRGGNRYGFLYGGLVLGTGPTITPNWTHLAAVRSAGVTTFYVNGVAAFTNPTAPGTPAGNFMIGGNPLLATEHFDGLIDEVRVFTFAPGQFVVADLNLLGAGLPVPATSWPAIAALALLLAALAGLALSRRSA